ncbi:family 16 glycosylhydrolase [Colwellia sp. 1_MG-2023]|uniref:family 16 glycosylhydrolase n=1 Tax=Colwellia sp. 1_MG-2023 TaxID=3062649 RepID=UPI0026E2DC2E|nr:family 16 glycosylhydrolase [Colwellia sp. 1_MG-2023]MDO6444163.1 family 16 glycosylhydrolase [Colwellia sp. 1_MG-2023]
MSLLSFAQDFFPLSDSENKDGWVLNPSVSDEFNGSKLDRFKWYIQGENEQFYLWKGRAPSQFAPHNVLLEDGFLKLRTQWEPNYAFVGKPPKRQEIDAYENITTAAIISHNTFLYGYMEVRVKIPDAAMTGAFWGTGYQQELDVFELIGRVKKGSRKPETTFVTSIHDWRPGHPKKNKVWKHPHPTPGRTAENFYAYGVEWQPDGLNMYFEGELVHQVTQKEMGDAWVLNNPLELWFDSEVFPWHGIPEEKELPANFEIDYVRVWQKPDSNLLQPAFFGFEGPYMPHVVNKPELRGKYAKQWWIDPKLSTQLKISQASDYHFSTGRHSLQLNADNKEKAKEFVAFSPDGSVILTSGEYQLSFDVFIEEDSFIKAIQIVLENPWLEITPIDLSHVQKGKWVTLKQTFSRSAISAENDRMRVVFKKEWFAKGNNTLAIDNINISKINSH